MGRLRHEARLLEGQSDPELLRGAQILEVLEAGVLVLDANGVVTRCNGAAGRLLGVDPDAIVGHHLPLAEAGLLFEDGAPLNAERDPVARTLETGKPEECILICATRQPKSAWMELTVRPLPPATGWPTGGVVCSLLEVTKRRAAERELRTARYRAERYLDMAGSIIVALDAKACVTRINRAGLRLLGYKEQELVGRNWIETVVPPDARDHARQVLEAMLGGVEPREIDPRRVEAPVMTRAGAVRMIEWRSVVVDGDDGRPTELLCAGTDVTERLRHAEAVTHLAYHDQLTGLPNRALLEEHLEVALARAEREGRELSLLFLDLDNFKLVNDSLGHHAGDRLLQLVAERLLAITRASDLLARHGGDELLLLITDIEGGSAAEVAESVAEKLLESLEEPFEIGGTSFEIGASVGVAVFPADGRSASALLRAADATMYQAKAAGRNRVALHRPGLPLDRAGELISATTRLRRALSDSELEVYYQPILSLPEGSVHAVEALVRWNDPRRGLVAASEFLQLAEETGLVESIGEWVIESVCAQAARWRDAGLDTGVHFNLSPRQLRQRHLIDSIRSAMDNAAVDPGLLTAEIGDSAALSESRSDSAILHKLHGLGLSLAIDNFGAGNSTLGRLRELPVSELKLHRLLLRGVPHERGAGALARAVIEMAEALGMRAVAEGVETEDQWRFLVDHGCPLAQGFHLGRPAPAAEVEPLLLRRAG
jgi:diguanylate cyclase (GGDEF)-like protein/PAS domain S-box-containing protein